MKPLFIPSTVMLLLLVYTGRAQDVQQMARQKAVSLHGSFDIRGISYSANGIASRRQPFSYIFSGAPTLSFYGFDIPVSFSISEQDRSFSQPFNQFGLSPKYKWLTLHGGYRNLSFSPYTLDGHTMLGAGLEINPGKFHFAIMYGRLNRATTVDTTLGTLQPFSFSRKGLAFKLGIGDERSYFNISILKASDDSASVNNIAPITKQDVRAAANAVASIAFRMQFFKKIFLEGDAGASLYTDDIGSQLAISTTNDWAEKIRSIMPVNGTTAFYAAYRAAFGFTGNIFSLKAEYKHIDPDFKSMGTYFFNSDIESYTLSPSVNLAKGRFRFNGSIGSQRDNTKGQKQSTTSRAIAMANIGWDITRKFGLDASYTNFSSNSKPTVVLVQNKYLLAQNNNSLSFTPRYVSNNERYTHVVIASYNRSILTDDNTITQTQNNITTDILFFNYNLTLVKSGIGLTAGVNHANNSLITGNFENMGYTAGINRGWFNGKLMTALTNTYTVSKGPQGKSNIYNLMFNGNYQAGIHHRFSLRYSLLQNSPEIITATQLRYRENTGEAAYTFSF
ncbi:MAG: hypothetical protein V4557_15270 [Bacteroidota bacterium]